MVSHKQTDNDTERSGEKSQKPGVAKKKPIAPESFPAAPAETTPEPRGKAARAIKKTTSQPAAPAAAAPAGRQGKAVSATNPPASEEPAKPARKTAPRAPSAAKAPEPAVQKPAAEKPAVKMKKPAATPAPAAKAAAAKAPEAKASKAKEAATKAPATKAAAAKAPAAKAPATKASAAKAPTAKKTAVRKSAAPKTPPAAPAETPAETKPAAKAQPIRRTTRAAQVEAAATAAPASAPAAPEPVVGPPHREAAPPPAAPAVPQPVFQAEVSVSVGLTRAVLMIRDPEWLYTYWEISPADREAHAIGRPHGAPPLLLRVFELGGGREETAEASHAFDVTVLPEAGGWYVHLPPGGGRWRVALGYLDYEGNLVTLAHSNVVTTPGPIQAEWNEQAWGPLAEEFEVADGVEVGEAEIALPGGPSRLVRRASRLISYLRGGASELGLRPGASEQLLRPGASEQFLRPGASEQVTLRPGASEQALRPGASEQVTLRPGASEQFAIPGSGQMGQMGRQVAVEAKGKTFWLQVHTELIVYGATEPDARVTVQGQPIRLRPDGTFTLRFALPDGEQVIPVHAVNADGDMERTITPIVTKKTV